MKNQLKPSDLLLLCFTCLSFTTKSEFFFECFFTVFFVEIFFSSIFFIFNFMWCKCCSFIPYGNPSTIHGSISACIGVSLLCPSYMNIFDKNAAKFLSWICKFNGFEDGIIAFPYFDFIIFGSLFSRKYKCAFLQLYISHTLTSKYCLAGVPIICIIRLIC